ncbi:MAG TPA: hypothetical protein VGU70_07220 [Methylobacterium sp.]|jgi:hypothetical protein|uniref:hypothetical protein n=1 Tax=Methylorubrum sp. B1-46 TaxID=2897334 RepID=UPI001E4093BD|nr:hypothetical protein [Methylorubrum sp. B1-46]UGB23927.1 hypothetical protein LPC10_13120 [Methylorubrum sp. B1-46]HEV2542537.1 hypothetical protein [Methylobacterium sp.]
MRVGCAVVLIGLLIPSASRGLEARSDVATFIETAQHHIGERVTLEHCHLVYTTEEEITCVGLLPKDAAGEVRMAGKLLIRVGPAEMSSHKRALAHCAGGALNGSCEVNVSGEVYDAARSFGLGEARLIGLREAAIRWPD